MIYRLLVAVAGAAVVLTGAVGSALPQAQITRDVIQNAILRTVLFGVLGPDQNGIAICSGAFVTPGGMILTASHCVRATEDLEEIGIRRGQLFNPEGLLLVSVNRPGQVGPVPYLWAKFIADVPTLDLAIVQVGGLFRGRRPQPLPTGFTVPYLTIGNSDAMRHGDAIAVIGFPGVGGETVTVNLGTVSGFEADRGNRKLSMKIDAQAARGSSGGPVINDRGDVVGVLSHVFSERETAGRSVRATLTNRIPQAWRQLLAGTPKAPSAQSPRTRIVFRGLLLDADSGTGVPNAYIVIIRPGVSLEEATEEDIIALGRSDSAGFYQTTPPVSRGQRYAVITIARGYGQRGGYVTVPAQGADVFQMSAIWLRRE